MKKFLAVIFSILLALGLCACNSEPKELQKGTPYVYSGVTFYRAEDLTLEELANYNPAMNGAYRGGPIETLDDLERVISENLDTYTVKVQTDNGVEVLHYDPIFKSVTITDESISFLVESGEKEQTFTFTYTKNGNEYVAVVEGTELKVSFTDGVISYEKPITERFKVIYNYKIYA